MNITFRSAGDHYKILKGSGPVVVGHIWREGKRWIAYDTSIGRYCGDDKCTHRSLSAAKDAAEQFYSGYEFCHGGCGLLVGTWNYERTGRWYCAACALDYAPQATEHATDAITGGYADLLEYGDAC
jgi:hypothetical protein